MLSISKLSGNGQFSPIAVLNLRVAHLRKCSLLVHLG
jgi:hypothetical protein